MNSEKKYKINENLVQYHWNEKYGVLELNLWPICMADKVCAQREKLQGPEVDYLDFEIPEPYIPVNLAQINIAEMGQSIAFAQGRTMQGSPASEGYISWDQNLEENESDIRIITQIKHPFGFIVEHILTATKGTAGFFIRTGIKNTSEKKFTLQMLSSFSLGGLNRFHPDEASESLYMRRFRSGWSSEGRAERILLEDLNLERSWCGYANFSERFGQVGSQPVRGFFPFIGIEDSAHDVYWGAQLAIGSSWQMEVFRKTDNVSISGGIADRELGHWTKVLEPGESFTSPEALVAVSELSMEDATHRLLTLQESRRYVSPLDEDLPIIFNEWCSSWGKPTHSDLITTAKALSQTDTKIIMIDDGWAERPGDQFQVNGDWNLNHEAFPHGLKAVCDELKELGFIPGLWFEFEVCNIGSEAYEMEELFLRRDGNLLRVGTRNFLDFRKGVVKSRVKEKVIDLLKNAGFQYLKIDYNETIGIGVDGSDSLGEGLREHIEAVLNFIKEIRQEIPGIIIENCSSGGHRLEPLFQSNCSMGSFSDAHETVEIPIIASNVTRLNLASQIQVWAVLRETDTIQRMEYSLAATFIGRMCISGNMLDLAAEQMEVLKKAQSYYRKLVPLIKEGHTQRYSKLSPSMRKPKGWQCYIRENRSGDAYLVFHAFAEIKDLFPLHIPLEKKYEIVDSFGDVSDCAMHGKDLVISKGSEFTGFSLLLKSL